MRPRLAFAAAILVCAPAFASGPGQPLDCADWVFLQPGYSCSAFQPLPSNSIWRQGKGSSIVNDNTGALLTLRFRYVEAYTTEYFTLGRTEIVRRDETGEHVLGFIEDRPNTPPTTPRDQFRPVTFWDFSLMRGDSRADIHGTALEPISFDAAHGTLLLYAYTCSEGCGGIYPQAYWIVSITGFATTFEVLQTFTPQASLGFRVPYMPEGMPAADSFDTYYGPLTNPINFAQAQPLACDYPASAPAVGDYLAVTDPLPNPAPGTGRYYVTSATHNGVTRYGRKTSAGVLSGRDPGLLPECLQP